MLLLNGQKVAKYNDVPDALSCIPVSDPENVNKLAEPDTNGYPEISLSGLELCMVIPLKASVYKTSGNMFSNILNMQNFILCSYINSLITEVKYQNSVDSSGTSASNFLWMMHDDYSCRLLIPHKLC